MLLKPLKGEDLFIDWELYIVINGPYDSGIIMVGSLGEYHQIENVNSTINESVKIEQMFLE